MRIVHNANQCASTGMCEGLAPTVFEVGSDGSLRVLLDEPSQALRAAVQDAVDACPTGALRIQE